ncbi:MAG: T9SS type A sorting domain-containing protein, partial [Bacteroidia bacterium]
PDTISIFISKYTMQGNHIWTNLQFPNRHSNGGHQFPQIANMIFTKHKTLIMSASADFSVLAYVNNSFVCFDSLGNVQWQKTCKRNNNDTFFGSWIANSDNNNDSNYYFVTITATKPFVPSQGPFNSVLLYGKLNHNGDTLWTKQFADTGSVSLDGYVWTEPRQIKKYKNKLYLLAITYYEGCYHPTLVITDSVGNVLSYREYDSNIFTTWKDILNMEVSDNRIMLSGYQVLKIYNPPRMFSWVISTDSLGCMLAGCEAADVRWQTVVSINTVNNQLVDVQLYPNPTNSYINVTASNSNITLCNSIGVQLLYTNTTAPSTTLDLTPYASGIYYVRVTNNNETQTFKVIKE